MSLLTQFEDSGKEVYEVTCQEWANIMKDHFINSCNRSIDEFNNTNIIEVKCFHREQVYRALEKGIEVPEIVLRDYPTLKSELQTKQDKINSIPILTQDIFNTLQEGNKITVNGSKLTIHKKKDNSIVARIYRKRNKGLELIVGERYSLVMGWS